MKPANLRERLSHAASSLRLRPISLRTVLLLALLNGVLFYLVIPPWWHYDEPGQFEYAWLIANRRTWPKRGWHDEDMRRQMAKSMDRYGWYDVRGYKLNLNNGQPVWIGAGQGGGQPAYYFAASLPLRLLHRTSIITEYRVARALSLIFYLLAILLVWKTLDELLSEDHVLRWVVTVFVALLPAFTDIMTSVSDDVGAILVSCLFLWLSIRLIRRGISVARLIPWAASLALCYLTKNTAWYALLVALPVLVFSVLRGRSVRWVWIATTVLALIAGLILVQGGGAAGWYQSQAQTPALRIQSPKAVVGTHVFQVEYPGAKPAARSGQFLGEDLVTRLRGKTVTLGMWAWANAAMTAQPPVVRFATLERGFAGSASAPGTSAPIQLQESPAFYQVVLTVPEDASYALLLPPVGSLQGRRVRVFFDGVVLAEGSYAGVPQFAGPAGERGTWAAQPFTNLVENGSAEQGGPRVRPAIEQATSGLFSSVGSLSAILSTVINWRATAWFYGYTAQTMFRTFWASVAADKFNLPAAANRILLGLTIIGLLGSARLVWRKRRVLRWDLMYVLAATLVSVWGLAVVRGLVSLLSASANIPWARYAFPAILPSALLICAGWVEWLEWLRARLNLNEWFVRLVPLVLMGVLSLYTLFNVEKYFHPSLAGREWMLWLAGLLLLGLLLLWQGNRLRQAAKTA